MIRLAFTPSNIFSFRMKAIISHKEFDLLQKAATSPNVHLEVSPYLETQREARKRIVKETLGQVESTLASISGSSFFAPPLTVESQLNCNDLFIQQLHVSLFFRVRPSTRRADNSSAARNQTFDLVAHRSPVLAIMSEWLDFQSLLQRYVGCHSDLVSF